MIERQIDACGEKIVIIQTLDYSHAGTVWDGALVLSAYCQKQSKLQNSDICEMIYKKNVLQLGSGTGVLGLSLAPLQPASMILTDLPQYTHLLKQNIDKNEQILKKIYENNSKIPFHCEALSWGKLEEHQKYFNNPQTIKIDSIIASQVAYSENCITQLLKTLVWLKANHNIKLKCLISYQKYEKPQRNLLSRLLSYNDEKVKFTLKGSKEDNNEAIQWIVEQVCKQDMDQFYQDDYIGILILT